jgi:cytochrome c peroxidase
MFSDFEQHVAGIPQIMPSNTNMVFDGPGGNEDFGLEQVTGNSADRYAFRTSPLRNVGLQPSFMHNGAFVRLEDAIRYHLNARKHADRYTTRLLPADLRGPMGPIEPVLARLDPRLRGRVELSRDEFDALVEFVRTGLLDPDAGPHKLRRLIPQTLPSGRPPLTFQFD